MVDVFSAIAISLAAVAGLVGLVLWLRISHQENVGQPLIELEKLVNCISCGSLIPEGVRRCAFCGAMQQEDLSLDQRTAGGLEGR